MRLSTGSRLLVLLASWLFVAFPTRALDLQLRGFADLIGTQTNSRLALSTINNGAHLTLDSETRIGLNLSSDLGNNLSFAGQLLAQGNDSGQYSLNALWIFAMTCASLSVWVFTDLWSSVTFALPAHASNL